VFKVGNRWGKGKGGLGERKGGEVSTQATWDQGGRESPHTPKEEAAYTAPALLFLAYWWIAPESGEVWDSK
jgi:hypothetical protein